MYKAVIKKYNYMTSSLPNLVSLVETAAINSGNVEVAVS